MNKSPLDLASEYHRKEIEELLIQTIIMKENEIIAIGSSNEEI